MAEVVVMVCDQRTGMPVSSLTRRPVSDSLGARGNAGPPLLAVTDPQGRFALENLPAGEYRLVAQRWAGPFKGFMELQGEEIRLFGTADHVRLPSAESEKVVLRPAGDGVLRFDQEVGNNETFLLLSTKPPAADPILGFAALGGQFLTCAIGFNRMPYGRTTVRGLPRGTVYAFFLAADNSPGFAHEGFEVGPIERVKRVPFVAGWSDGRKEPPPGIRRVMELLVKHGLIGPKAYALAGFDRDFSRLESLSTVGDRLDKKVELPEGRTATVGEILAAEGYRQLLESDARRRKPR